MWQLTITWLICEERTHFAYSRINIKKLYFQSFGKLNDLQHAISAKLRHLWYNTKSDSWIRITYIRRKGRLHDLQWLCNTYRNYPCDSGSVTGDWHGCRNSVILNVSPACITGLISLTSWFRKRRKFDGFQNKRPVRRAKGASKYPTRDTAKRISGVSRMTAEHSIKKEGPDRVYS